MVKLVENYGDIALEKLAGLQVSRGPLVSLDPSRDFLNASQGTLYIHKAIPGRKYYVLTHSSTSEKADKIIPQALDHLGIPPFAYKIRVG